MFICSVATLCSDLLLLRVGGISNGGPSWPPGTPKIVVCERANTPPRNMWV